ncbi:MULTISPECIES: TetR/AcrR family transcriptional regulator [unclassified Streptomyces]|uniref:TetR/AcrR family transcriptional regulator n=1 Tax=unclassified Streptomyces TaxID=2593676 RepID=UPI0006AD8DEF|nr:MULTISPECIES: ABC-F family ATP-binding cassette domain-containing protein [unclassified Streptomyces]ARE77945.1 TetR family transcriptional regulator [Streptomyces sp. Sge12]
MNQDRRDRLRDAAIGVLAEAGGRGLTHRAVDAAATVPTGTAKNYFPTRDALLRGAAERCAEQYRALAAALAGTGPGPADAAQLATLLAGLLRDVAGPGRPRVLAYLELRAEAARRPWLAALLDPVAASDFTAFAHLLAAAGLPAGPEPARALTLALHGAIPHLLTGAPATLAAAGLDDLDRFARDLLASVCEGANR